MNRRFIFNLGLLVIFCNYFTFAALGPFSSFFGLDKLEQTNSFTSQVEKEIDILTKRKIEQEEAYATHKADLEQFQNILNNLKEKLTKAKGDDAEFINLQITTYNQLIQAVNELELVHQSIINTVDTHIKLLQEYKIDPEFKSKSFYLPNKSIYSIEDLQKASNYLLQIDSELKSLEERLKKTSLDLENRKKTQLLSRQEYEEKKKEQRELKTKDSANAKDDSTKSKFTLAQEGELLDVQERLLRFKKDLADLRVKEIDQKGQLLEEQIKVAFLQKETLEKEYARIKREMSVNEKDVAAASAALEAQTKKAIKLQDELLKGIESLNNLKAKEQEEIKKYKEQFNISDAEVEVIASWSQTPNTFNGWRAQIDIGRITNHITYEIDISREFLYAQIDYEKAKVTEQEANKLIVTSWYKLSSNKFDRSSQEDLNREIKQYEKMRTDIQAHISSTSDNRAAAANALNNNSRIAENIKNLIKSFRDQKDSIFKNREQEYRHYTDILKNEATLKAHSRGEMIAQLIELYSNTSNLRSIIIDKLDMMITELRSKSQWRGAPPLWKGLQTFVPDINRFIRYLSEKDISQSIYSLKNSFNNSISYYSTHVNQLIYLILQVVAILVLLWFLKRNTSNIKHLITLISPKYGIGHTISSFIIYTLSFINNHIISITTWSFLYIAFKYRYIPDAYLGAIFFLLSIPFWLYYAYKFVRYLAHVNIQQHYIFASKKYQRKFLTIFSIFLYASIILLFFREAFLQVNFAKSSVPRILLALNFIILQISLIGMINKDQILSIIPKSNSIWKWIYDHVEQYYYLFLAGTIFIIVMSNPYLGYGPQFFYIISRILLILLLIPFFATLHSQVKRISSSLFFYSDGEVIRERFPYGRTSYGIFVIVSFVFFISLAVIIGANIWGYSVGIQDIYDWMQAQLYGFKDPETGRHVEVNVLKLGKVLFYVMGGMLVAYIVNRFILRRMFDLLLVNIGIQSAVSSLVRYVIVLAAIVIGLQSIGLSSSLLYVFAVIGGLGVAGKEIITDFIGYFMILIQRPIKIGDLIKIDDEVMGVVRHVNFRSVILRKKNSLTIIIPNSHVMTKPITNWNYTRTFFAFDDIMLTVPYSTDPCKVKELILKVLYNNINVLKNPAPIVQLREFTDNGFQFMVRGFLSPDKVLDQFDIASDIRIEIVNSLRANKMKVASPTRIVRVINQKAIDLNLENEGQDLTSVT